MSSSSPRAVSMMIGTLLSTAQTLAHLEAVEAREHHVEHDEVDRLLAEAAERLLAVARLHDRVAVPLERVREQRLDRFLVVDEEDCRGVGHRSVRAGPRLAGAPTIARRWKRLGPGRAVAGCVAALLNALLTHASCGWDSSSSSPALLALLFSISTTGTLPRSPLEPLFDGESAAVARRRRSRRSIPSRVPGSEGAAGAARWYARDRSRRSGSTTEEDVWTEDLAGPRRRRAPERRDRRARDAPRRRSSSLLIATTPAPISRSATTRPGPAALIELARGFAPQELGPDPLPQRTLVLVSTDAGAYGGAGAARFARDVTARARRRSRSSSSTASAGAGGRASRSPATSPCRPLARSSAPLPRASRSRSASRPSLPSFPSQLVDLGHPVRARRAGSRSSADGLAAVTLDDGEPDRPAFRPATRRGPRRSSGSASSAARPRRSSARSTRASAAPFARPTASSSATGRRAGGPCDSRSSSRVVPFALGRRRPDRSRPAAWASVRAGAPGAARPALLLRCYGGLLLWLGALPASSRRARRSRLPRTRASLDEPPVVGLAPARSARSSLGWLVARRRLVAAAQPTAEERLAGLAVALAVARSRRRRARPRQAVRARLRPAVALRVALAPARRAALWQRAVLFALGPPRARSRASSCSAHELGLSVARRGRSTSLGLVTVGYVPLGSVLLALAWAGRRGAGRRARRSGATRPYAGGVEPPPRRADSARRCARLARLVEREVPDEPRRPESRRRRAERGRARRPTRPGRSCATPGPRSARARRRRPSRRASRADELVAVRVPAQSASAATP